MRPLVAETYEWFYQFMTYSSDFENMQRPMLSNEAIGIVQHVELNRSGWWDKALQRLVIAAIWLSTEPNTEEEIRQKIQSEFSLAVTNGKLHAALVALDKQSLIFTLPSNRYRIPDKVRETFSKEIAETEAVFENARQVFLDLSAQLSDGLDSSLTWQTFESEFLRPLIAETGANAYNLIAGHELAGNDNLSSNFLAKFDSKHHLALKQLVTAFLNPKIEHVRSYVSRMLHARFCVEAGGLPASTIQKLNSATGRKIKFRVFVDTNFLFSLLQLHENPSNEAARELLELVKQLKSNLGVQLYVLPRTVEEAKTSIASAMHRLSRLPPTNKFSAAAQKIGISGMAEKFISERTQRGGKLTVEDWFDPYLKDFVSIARSKGIELFNENLNALATRGDVTDDILQVIDYEMKRDESRRKSYEKVAHDMIMWHFINDLRPAYVESPIDVQDWILTVDFRFIGFDEYKQRQSNSKVPICLHPTSLVQLLQFWVPRTKEFEEAMLGSIRLPFLFQEFDVEAERTSIRILNGLGRFEGRDDLTTDTIVKVVLNDGLRSKLSVDSREEGSDEVALIRDALLEEVKAEAAAESEKAKELAIQLATEKTNRNELDARHQAQVEELNHLAGQVAMASQQSEAANDRLAEQDIAINLLTNELAAARATQTDAIAMAKFIGLIALVVLVAIGFAWNAAQLFPSLAYFVGDVQLMILVAVLVFVAGHLLLELTARGDDPMKQLWHYRQISRFRGWLWSLVISSFVLGVVGNLYANQLQKKLDQKESQQKSETPSNVASAPKRQIQK